MPPSFCYMKACPNRNAKKGSMKHFGFPTCNDVKEDWIAYINTGNRTVRFTGGTRAGVRLCQDHFEPHCFALRQLKKGAKPTIFPTFTPELAVKEGLITFPQSPFLESVNNFELSTTELRQLQQSLCEVEPDSPEQVTVDDEQASLDPRTGLLYDPTEMPTLAELMKFDPLATSSFGKDPIHEPPTTSDQVMEDMNMQVEGEQDRDEYGVNDSVPAINKENVAPCETPRQNLKRRSCDNGAENVEQCETPCQKLKRRSCDNGAGNVEPCETPRQNLKRRSCNNGAGKKSTIKRRAFVGDLSMGAFSSPRSAKRSLNIVTKQVRGIKIKLKGTQQRLRRALKKISTLSELLDTLKDKNHIDEPFKKVIEVQRNQIRKFMFGKVWDERQHGLRN